MIAGFIATDGGHPAFPKDDDARAEETRIDLYAVIKGANYALHVVTAEQRGDYWGFMIPVECEDLIILGVKRTAAFSVGVLELDWPTITSTGKKEGGYWFVALPLIGENPWKELTSFEKRF